jgi:hypothetical protein
VKRAIFAILGMLAFVGVWAIAMPWWSSTSEWRTPIKFYGKVLDEKGSPVPNARIELSCNDLSLAGTSTYHRNSDSNGLFSIAKIRGKLLVVNVAKDGFYTSRADNDAFYYAGQNVNFIANSAKPEVFHLRHAGVAEPLLHIQSPLGGGRGFTIDTNGLPLELSLTSGAVAAPGQGDLRVECWTKHYAGNWKFDWRCRIAVVHGGLQPAKDEFPFQAPLEGYAPSEEIDMPVSLKEDWSNGAKRSYFVRLANGNYARLNFEIIPSGDHFILLDSYLNPSGSRNLEFDPNKIVPTTN